MAVRWDIENELGETIEDSPFAKALRGNIRGVVMVLDSDVLPLTRPLDESSKPCLLRMFEGCMNHSFQSRSPRKNLLATKDTSTGAWAVGVSERDAS